MRLTQIFLTALFTLAFTFTSFAQWTRDAGTSTVRLTTSGDKLGVGVTSTGSKAQINGSMAVGYSSSTTAPANGLLVNGNWGLGTSTVGSKGQINGNLAVGYSASTAAPWNGLLVSGNTVIGGYTDTSCKVTITDPARGIPSVQVGRRWLPDATKPYYMLGVSNHQTSGNVDCILNLNSAAGQSGVEFFVGGQQNWYVLTYNTPDGSNPLITWNNKKCVKYMRQDGVEFHFGQMVITNDQTWTMPGSYKLAVDGKIGARELVVTVSNWSDFVFKKDYKLPSLSEVEKHINKYGRLKGIPSEQEAKAGVSVGDMQAKLLQKVEELTLYMIDLKKENEALKVQVNNLAKN